MGKIREHIQEGLDKAREFLKMVHADESRKSDLGIDLNHAAEILSNHKDEKINIIEDDLTGITKKLGINDEISGLTFLSDDKKRYIIVVEESDMPHRKRFTIAHEMGHIFMNDIKDGKSILFRSTLPSAGEQYLVEQKANAFAGEILMPSDQVLALRKSGLNLEEMAIIFGVSYAAMKVKVNGLQD